MMKYKRFNIWTVMTLLEEAQMTGTTETQLFKRSTNTFASIKAKHTVDDTFIIHRGDKLLGVFKNKGEVWNRLEVCR